MTTKTYSVKVECDGERFVLSIMRNYKTIEEHADGGEPEDQSFGRDWSWVPEALEQAYKYGLEDGISGK